MPGIGSHHSARPQTDEWLTPPHIFEAFHAAGHRFDLDPCFPLEGIPWARMEKAGRHFLTLARAVDRVMEKAG